MATASTGPHASSSFLGLQSQTNGELVSFAPAPAMSSYLLDEGPDCHSRLRDGRSASLPACVAGHKVVLEPAVSVADDRLSAQTLQSQFDRMLLDEVVSLTADRQHLLEQCSGLQKENQQLKNLVLDLSDTLQQQQQQARVLMQLQRLQLLKSSDHTLSHHGGVEAPVTQHVVQQQGPRTLPPAPVMPAGEDEDPAEVSATLPSANALTKAHQQWSQGHKQHQHQLVEEWLQERGWQEWQEQLPLEPVSSASSSSIILALEDSMLRL